MLSVGDAIDSGREEPGSAICGRHQRKIFLEVLLT
jgi:hypothetical protein